MATLSLNDESGDFDATVPGAAGSRRVVLFAVGAGGNPERHQPLLAALAENGCAVVAPHFERLASANVTDDDLLLRARRLRLVLDTVAAPDSVAVGVGHSIGATMLLALAGGRLWMRSGHCLSIERDERLGRLVLLTPATGFFQAPGALDDVRTPMLVWAGTDDTITPPTQAAFIKQALGDRVPVQLQIEEGAGHFSFMNVPPPHVTEPLSNREAFLARLTADILRFVLA